MMHNLLFLKDLEKHKTYHEEEGIYLDKIEILLNKEKYLSSLYEGGNAEVGTSHLPALHISTYNQWLTLLKNIYYLTPSRPSYIYIHRWVSITYYKWYSNTTNYEWFKQHIELVNMVLWIDYSTLLINQCSTWLKNIYLFIIFFSCPMMDQVITSLYKISDNMTFRQHKHKEQKLPVIF